MNAERLHAIVNALHDEVQVTSYPSHLQELVDGLQMLSEAPNQPEPQARVSAARELLNKVLRESTSNNFSPVWQQALDEMGISDLVGETLLERIEVILQGNEITPNIAAGELGEIRDRVNNLVSALDQAQFVFNFLQIPSEELAPGEFEIGVMIPRQAVDNGLEALGREFIELKQIIAPFSELAGENRPEFRIRSISSSEFQIFLDSAPAAAALIATTFERLMKSYERFLKIRKLHRELSDEGVPDQDLGGVSAFVSSAMQADIQKIVEEVIEESNLTDEGRLNELRTDLTIRISALAERIDSGYDVEIRAGELPEPTDDESDDPEIDAETKRATEKVLEAERNLEFLHIEGKSILRLNPPSAEDDPDAAQE